MDGGCRRGMQEPSRRGNGRGVSPSDARAGRGPAGGRGAMAAMPGRPALQGALDGMRERARGGGGAQCVRPHSHGGPLVSENSRGWRGRGAGGGGRGEGGGEGGRGGRGGAGPETSIVRDHLKEGRQRSRRPPLGCRCRGRRTAQGRGGPAGRPCAVPPRTASGAWGGATRRSSSATGCPPAMGHQNRRNIIGLQLDIKGLQ